MKKVKENIDIPYRYFFIFFLILNLTRIIASLIPDMYLIGLDFYKYLPINVSVIFIVLSFVFLSKPVNEKVVSLIQYTARVIYKENGDIKWFNVSIFFCCALICFYYLRIIPLLGDGTQRIQDLDKIYVRTIKDYFHFRGFESFTLILYSYTAKLLTHLDIDNYQTFYVYNCISGLIFVYYLLRLQTELFENKFNRTVSYIYLIIQAYLNKFFRLIVKALL